MLYVNGTLQVDGNIGASGHTGIGTVGCGGGSGGSISVTARYLSGMGTIRATGGSALFPSSPSAGGGGAGGRILVNYEDNVGFF